uniref:BTB domain-containing protein n=1 Tax=Caenorhabditis tropicalis TaxID=1561998 RepID=A0A1I7UKS6_9PELO
MSNRHKYAFNGVGFFENAREHIERDNFPEIPIGSIGGMDGWYLTMIQNIFDDGTCYHPFIHKPGLKPKLKIRYRYVFLKKDGSSELIGEGYYYLNSDHGFRGAGKTVEEWLDEEEGYLTNGGITIEYGFQIEGILSPEGVWTFNFHDRLFDCQEQSNMISFYKQSRHHNGITFFHCHKQLLTFHSTYFNSDSNENQMFELTDENLTSFNDVLQIIHGVRIGDNNISSFQMLRYARKYEMFNVIQLLDQVWKSMDIEIALSTAFSHGLNHYLAKFLDKQKTSKELAEKLKDMDLETMSGEMMKKCIKRFFELAIPDRNFN